MMADRAKARHQFADAVHLGIVTGDGPTPIAFRAEPGLAMMEHGGKAAHPARIEEPGGAWPAGPGR